MNIKINYLEICLLFLLSLVGLGLFNIDVLPPYGLNWDLFEHQTLINEIKNGNVSYFTSNMSDTFLFNGYPPLFHLLNSIPQLLLKPYQSSYYWYVIQIIYYFATLILVYKLSKYLSGKTEIASISVILSIFVFESFGAYTRFFLLPQTFSALISMISFIYLLKYLKENSQISLYKAVGLGIISIFCHYIIGFLYLILAVFTIILNKTNSYLYFAIFNLIFLILLVLFNEASFINLLNTHEGQIYNLTLQDKIFHLNNWYGYILYTFGIFAVAYNLYKRNLKNLEIICYATLLLIGFLFRIPSSAKFFVIGSYLINTMIAVGFVDLATELKNNYLKAGFKTIFLIILIAVFARNINWYKSTIQSSSDYYSHYSLEEIEASKFLYENYKDKNALLISDPATQYVLEAFSGINSQGGTYMNDETRKTLIDFNRLKDLNLLFNVKDTVEENPQKINLLILSGRYFSWQKLNTSDKMSTTINIWSPVKLDSKDLKDINYLILKGKNTIGLQAKEVYRNGELVILEVKRINSN